MDTWPVNQLVLSVTTYLKPKYIVIVQQIFRRKFIIPVDSNVLSQILILDWYHKFQNIDNVSTLIKAVKKVLAKHKTGNHSH